MGSRVGCVRGLLQGSFPSDFAWHQSVLSRFLSLRPLRLGLFSTHTKNVPKYTLFSHRAPSKAFMTVGDQLVCLHSRGAGNACEACGRHLAS